ncbi:MAG: hypothetical protein FWF10_03465 [Clostridiales bacterium]|nr:hypothetical protein [Clostridiales bacterium]
MKRILSILFAVQLTLLPLTALADVVFSVDNDFYERHKDDCVPVNQSFCFPEGEITLKKEPDSEFEVYTPAYLFATHGYYVDCAYNHGGALWGYLSGVSHGDSYAGWIPLEGAMLAYNAAGFERDYRDAFYDYPGGDEAVLERLEAAEHLIFWLWPCSGRPVYGDSWHFPPMNNVADFREAGDYSFLRTFRDDEGREWAYFSCGWKAGWICLDDPENASIPVTIDHPGPWEWNMKDYPLGRPDRPDNKLVWTIVLICVAVLASAGLVLFLWKPKKKTEQA